MINSQCKKEKVIIRRDRRQNFIPNFTTKTFRVGFSKTSQIRNTGNMFMNRTIQDKRFVVSSIHIIPS
jgi:hypothetical protein